MPCCAGGKDSTVLAYVLSLLNARHSYGLDLLLLSVDEGISGYRDDSLETVKRNEQQYKIPLTIVSYRQLYGWTMDEIVRQIGTRNNCTFCGVFRRQALDRGAYLLHATKVATGALLPLSPPPPPVTLLYSLHQMACTSGKQHNTCQHASEQAAAKSAQSHMLLQQECQCSHAGVCLFFFKALSFHLEVAKPSQLACAATQNTAMLGSSRADSEHQLNKLCAVAVWSPCPQLELFPPQASPNAVLAGHNADDIAETVLLNFLRGDLPRLGRCAGITTGEDGALPRVKPFKYTYEKEIVMYAHFKKLDYFSTECIYAPYATRGHVREFIKDLEVRLLWCKPA